MERKRYEFGMESDAFLVELIDDREVKDADISAFPGRMGLVIHEAPDELEQSEGVTSGHEVFPIRGLIEFRNPEALSIARMALDLLERAVLLDDEMGDG